MVIKLDSVQASLLLTLLDSENPLSAVQIGKQVGISARALRYRLPLLESWLTTYGAKLVVKPRKGIALIATPQIRQSLREELTEEFVQPSLPNDDRIAYLLFLLLFYEGSTSFSELQTELGVSRSTFIRDLKRVENHLSEKGFSLKRIRFLGWKIIGEEIAKRHLLIEILYNHKISEFLAEWIAQRSTQTIPLTMLQKAILKKFQKLDLYEAQRLIFAIDNRLKLNLTDEDILYLTIYLHCSFYRMRQRHFVQIENRDFNETRILDEEITAIRLLLNQNRRETIHNLPKDEIVQFLLEIRACQGSLISMPEMFLDEDMNLSRVVTIRMIEKVEHLYGYIIRNDEIIHHMSIHLSRALSRLQAGLPLHNPLIEDVKKAYPHLWQPTSEVAHEVHQEFGVLVPETELAYLVMYLALAVQLAEQNSPQKFRVVVSCPTGGVMARLLVYRLQSAFPEIEVLDTVSLRDLHRYNPKNADLVITTVKRSHKTLPSITVNPLLGEEDILKIKKELRSFRYRKTRNQI